MRQRSRKASPHATMRATGLAVVTAAVTAVSLSGCGGSGQSGRNAASAPSSAPTLATPLSIGGGTAVSGSVPARYGAKSSHAAVATQPAGAAAVRAAHAPSLRFYARSVLAKSSEESKPTSQKIINPCGLVTRSEAASAIGTAVPSPREAPLGPTCIYETSNRKTFMTVSVQVRSFATVASQDVSLRRFAGLGRPAYCGGTTGATTLFVRLSAGEVLQVTGPCLTAAKLASHAIPRLHTAKGVPVTAP